MSSSSHGCVWRFGAIGARYFSRHTHDVDVLAMRGEIDGELMPAWPLPEYVKKYAAFIATTKHLDPDWLNATTSLMMIRLENFPREVWTGLVTEEFGPSLKVTFMGRIGLIYLKSMARVSRGEPRDLSDMEAMAPTAPEMERVARWLFTNELIPKTSPKPALKLLNELGHENVATKIERELA